jgi:hypothetical protein
VTLAVRLTPDRVAQGDGILSLVVSAPLAVAKFFLFRRRFRM